MNPDAAGLRLRDRDLRLPPSPTVQANAQISEQKPSSDMSANELFR